MLAVPSAGLAWTVNNHTLPAKAQGTYLQNSTATRCQHSKGEGGRPLPQCRLMTPVAGGGIAWWAHIGGFIAGWVLVPFIRRSERRYRRFYADEGHYGFFPDGFRSKGGQPWV